MRPFRIILASILLVQLRWLAPAIAMDSPYDVCSDGTSAAASGRGYVLSQTKSVSHVEVEGRRRALCDW